MLPYGARDFAYAFRTVRKNTIVAAEEIPDTQFNFTPADNQAEYVERMVAEAMRSGQTDVPMNSPWRRPPVAAWTSPWRRADWPSLSSRRSAPPPSAFSAPTSATTTARAGTTDC